MMFLLVYLLSPNLFISLHSALAPMILFYFLLIYFFFKKGGGGR